MKLKQVPIMTELGSAKHSEVFKRMKHAFNGCESSSIKLTSTASTEFPLMQIASQDNA